MREAEVHGKCFNAEQCSLSIESVNHCEDIMKAQGKTLEGAVEMADAADPQNPSFWTPVRSRNVAVTSL